MNNAVVHYYRKFRAEGYTALAAWNSARSFVAFRARLSADVKASKKLSRSAKKGWKTRRAAA